MAEDLEKKVAELEEKLNKARFMYKEQKDELEKTKTELEILRQNSAESNVTVLQQRIKELEEGISPSKETYEEIINGYKKKIKELEDEIIINGSSSEEIKTLNTRLDKAKEVYASQKEEIAKLNTEKTELIEKNKTISEELEGQVKILDSIRALVNC